MAQKKRTATGMALSQLAIKLMKKDRTLTLEDARTEAFAQIKRNREAIKKEEKLHEELEYGLGGKTKKKILTKLFGESVGGFISNRIRNKSHEADVANKLITGSTENEKLKGLKNYEAPQEEKIEPHQKVTQKEIKDINKKLDVMQQTSVKVNSFIIDKVSNIAENAKDQKQQPVRAVRSPFHKTGMDYMKKNYHGRMTKKEMEQAVMTTRGDTEQEFLMNLIKSGGKGGVRNHERVPQSQVPTIVSGMKTEVSTASAPTASIAPSVKSTDEVVSDPQKEAATSRTQQQHAEEVKEDKKIKETIIKKLDEILEHVKGGGILGMLGGLFSKFLSPVMKLIGPVLSLVGRIGSILPQLIKFLGPAAALAASAFAGYKVGQWIDEKTGASDKLVKGIEKVESVFGKGAEAAGKKATTTTVGADLRTTQNRALSDTSYTAVSPGIYRDSRTDETVKYVDLPQSVKAKLGQGIQAPDTSGVAKKIDAVSAENKNMNKSGAPIIQNIDARKNITAPSGGGGDSGGPAIVAINVRNMESSAASYISQIFNHTVLRLPV